MRTYLFVRGSRIKLLKDWHLQLGDRGYRMLALIKRLKQVPGLAWPEMRGGKNVWDQLGAVRESPENVTIPEGTILTVQSLFLNTEDRDRSYISMAIKKGDCPHSRKIHGLLQSNVAQLDTMEFEPLDEEDKPIIPPDV